MGYSSSLPFSVPLLETPIIISCLFFLTGFSRRLDHRSDHRPPAVFAVANLKGDFFKQTVWKAQECSHLLILSKERGVTTSGCGYFRCSPILSSQHSSQVHSWPTAPGRLFTRTPSIKSTLLRKPSSTIFGVCCPWHSLELYCLLMSPPQIGSKPLVARAVECYRAWK